MHPAPLNDATHRMGAPNDWDHSTDGICHTLEIHARDGWMYSVWRPSVAEFELLKAGHPVVLAIRGNVHPIVSVTVEKGVK